MLLFSCLQYTTVYNCFLLWPLIPYDAIPYRFIIQSSLIWRFWLISTWYNHIISFFFDYLLHCHRNEKPPRLLNTKIYFNGIHWCDLACVKGILLNVMFNYFYWILSPKSWQEFLMFWEYVALMFFITT